MTWLANKPQLTPTDWADRRRERITDGRGGMMNVALSLFPGIGLWDRAFEDEGYCVLRGPDRLWGGDIRRFNIPPHVVSGVFGGPPCQVFSALKALNPLAGEKHGNLIPEFERVVLQAQPEWFVMENVPGAPEACVPGYQVRSLVLNNRWVGGEQERIRRFSFGTRDGRVLDVDVALFENPDWHPTVLAGHGPVGRGKGYDSNPSIQDMCRLQGLPEDFLDDAPFTAHGKRRVIGNGVPLPLGRAIAKAVRRAMGGEA